MTTTPEPTSPLPAASTSTTPAGSGRVPLSERTLGWRGVAAVSVLSVALGGGGAAVLGAVTGGGQNGFGGPGGPGGFRGGFGDGAGFPGGQMGQQGQMPGQPGQQGQGQAPGGTPSQGTSPGASSGATSSSSSSAGNAVPAIWDAGLAGGVPIGSPHRRAMRAVTVVTTAPRDDVRPDTAGVVTTAV